MRVVIIVPTYNERENIAALIPALQSEFQNLAHESHILVVDDLSPDGTADAVRALQKEHRNVHLLTGEKRGLGAAYIRGMRYAIAELGADVVFEMDADFSHKPSDVPRLMAALESGADFVIGSRYVKGGSIPSEWGLHRRLNSRVGNFVARYVAGIYTVRDCTAGFRAIRTSLLKTIPLSDLRVQGYAFQVALLHAAKARGARIVEIPVDFVDRTRGESKLGIRDILEFILNAWWIRFAASATFLRFLTVGALGVLVNLGLFTLLLAAGWNKYLASPAATAASILSNFFLNHHWTFRQRNQGADTGIRGLKFNVVSGLTLLLNYAGFVVFSALLPDWPPQGPQALGILPATLANYFLSVYWTYVPVAGTPANASQTADRR